jgi:FdhD protein
MQPVDQETSFYKYSRGKWQPLRVKVISEALVSLTVNGDVWLSFMCTPSNLEALAVGFLFNEQIIQSKTEIASVHVCASGDNIDVWLDHPVEKPAQWQRTSGCGTGMTRADGDHPPARLLSTPHISPDLLIHCMDMLIKSQTIYQEARGIHAAALTDGQRIYFQVEDIGRHNTLDKLAGFLILEPVEISPFIVLTTGRVSLEMLNKSARMGADVVLSRTSPTTRSIQQADLAGITLIGYARRTELNVYAHPERLKPPEGAHSMLDVPVGFKTVE